MSVTVRPVTNTSSIAAWTSAYLRSGNASRTGTPRPSLPPIAITSSEHRTMTCIRPRNRATAFMLASPKGESDSLRIGWLWWTRQTLGVICHRSLHCSRVIYLAWRNQGEGTGE